jgi:hypothetical protein
MFAKNNILLSPFFSLQVCTYYWKNVSLLPRTIFPFGIQYDEGKFLIEFLVDG